MRGGGSKVRTSAYPARRADFGVPWVPRETWRLRMSGIRNGCKRVLARLREKTDAGGVDPDRAGSS